MEVLSNLFTDNVVKFYFKSSMLLIRAGIIVVIVLSYRTFKFVKHDF